MKNNAELMAWAESNHIPIALYGAGKYGKIALANMKIKYPKIHIACFIDDDLDRNDKSVEGIQVVSIKEAIETIHGGIIYISNYYVVETLKRLENADMDLSKVIFDNEMLIEPIEMKYIKSKNVELSKVYDWLQDYESKIIYRTIVESRFTQNIDLLSRTCHDGQYFPMDIFTFSDREVFVDGGAFDGDTIDSFRRITNDEFKYIYAFEPDVYNYKRLTKKHQDNRIRLFNMGLYDSNGIVAFLSGKGGSSQVIDESDDSIRTCCFDDLELPAKDVTFIKMDIEGSEIKALYGMEKLICRCKPKLAICIYHKFQDIWEIPLYIKYLVPEYKLYIRNYTTYLDEIVLYATI